MKEEEEGTAEHTFYIKFCFPSTKAIHRGIIHRLRSDFVCFFNMAMTVKWNVSMHTHSWMNVIYSRGLM